MSEVLHIVYDALSIHQYDLADDTILLWNMISSNKTNLKHVLIFIEPCLKNNFRERELFGCGGQRVNFLSNIFAFQFIVDDYEVQIKDTRKFVYCLNYPYISHDVLTTDP